MRPRQWATLIVLALLALAAVAFRLGSGSAGLVWPDSSAVWSLRLDRAACGAVVGASLAVAGVLLQSLLRNPLASPDLLGLASGAGLGAMVAVYAGFVAGHGVAHQSLAQAPTALAGALLALAVVYALGQRRGVIEPVSLILIGVIVGVMCAGGTMFLQYLLPDRGQATGRWLVGAISDDVSRASVIVTGALALAAVALGAWGGPAMDAASASDDEARSLGVPLKALRIGLFVASGVLSAASVYLAGPIGFVGLVCPHVVRLAAGPGHRVVVIGSALAGAAMIVAGDAAIALIDLGGGRMPLGVLTAIIGGPALIVLLRRRRGEE
ncbi:MAG TPA: iron ABC transporter permease [Phycisphaerales bacterium]|nr:iron ABC transporter permease [Phycisphaerales bacterium]